jgi:hypothetical protein
LAEQRTLTVRISYQTGAWFKGQRRCGSRAWSAGFGVRRRCLIPITVADLASAIRLPLGVVRVLLDDLVHDGLIDTRTTAPRGPVTDKHLLQKVLNGLYAL